MAQFYNKRVNNYPFKPKQLVLKKLEAQGKVEA